MLDEIFTQMSANGQQLWQAFQWFHQPHNRQPLQRKMGFKSLPQHPYSTNAFELTFRIATPERLNQIRPQNIAGRFASNNAYSVYFFHDGEISIFKLTQIGFLH